MFIVKAIATIWAKLMKGKFRYPTLFLIFTTCLLLVGFVCGTLDLMKIPFIVAFSAYMTWLTYWFDKDPRLSLDR